MFIKDMPESNLLLLISFINRLKDEKAQVNMFIAEHKNGGPGRRSCITSFFCWGRNFQAIR